MMIKNIQKEFKKRLEEKLDEIYPKGEVLEIVEFKKNEKLEGGIENIPLPELKEYRPRSDALLLNSYANIILGDLLKDNPTFEEAKEEFSNFIDDKIKKYE